VLWISGDTVLHDGMRPVADRSLIGTAILHLGAVQFPVTRPIVRRPESGGLPRLHEWAVKDSNLRPWD
jgi:hypothetical protein